MNGIEADGIEADGTWAWGPWEEASGVVGVEDGKKAARACALTMLSVLRAQLGSLNHIKRLVKATGFVNSTAGRGE